MKHMPRKVRLKKDVKSLDGQNTIKAGEIVSVDAATDWPDAAPPPHFRVRHADGTEARIQANDAELVQ